MLYNPRHHRKPFDFFLPPSFEGFTAFVNLKVQDDPDGSYNWSSCTNCAVGQYLWMTGAFDGNWRDPENTLLMQLDDIAEGESRDERGRFVNKATQWTWKALAQRLERFQQRRLSWSPGFHFEYGQSDPPRFHARVSGGHYNAYKCDRGPYYGAAFCPEDYRSNRTCILGIQFKSLEAAKAACEVHAQ